MAELPDRVPGEIIFASFENQLIQRSIQRYADSTQRNALNPIPEKGAFAYLIAEKLLQVWDGSEWVHFIDETEFDPFVDQQEINTPRAETFINQAYSAFVAGELEMEATDKVLTSVVIPSNGDFLFRGTGEFNSNISSVNQSVTCTATLVVNGGVVATYTIKSYAIGTGLFTQTEFVQNFAFPLKGAVGGQLVELKARVANLSTNTYAVSDRFCYLNEVPGGLLV